MPRRKVTKKPPPPIEFRFRTADLQKLKIAARAEKKRFARFVIEAALCRADQVLQMKLPLTET